MSDDPSLTYLRDELLQLGVMLNDAKCEPWVFGLRLRNIAELFNRSIGGSMRIDTDFTGGGLLLKALGCSLYNFDGAEFVECKHSVWNEILERLGVPAPTRDGAESAGDDAPIAWEILGNSHHKAITRDRGVAEIWQNSGLTIRPLYARSAQIHFRTAAPPKPAPDAMRALIARAVCCPQGCQYEGDSEDGSRCYCDTSDYHNSGVERRTNAVLDAIASNAEYLAGPAPVPSPDGAGEIENAFLNLCEALGLQATPLAYLDAAAARSAILPSPAVAAEQVAHYHRPSTMHMGDCSICGNISDHPLHIGSPSINTVMGTLARIMDFPHDGNVSAQAMAQLAREAIVALSIPVQPGAGERGKTIRECIVAVGSCSADGIFTPGGMRSAIIKDLKALQAPHSSSEGGR